MINVLVKLLFLLASIINSVFYIIGITKTASRQLEPRRCYNSLVKHSIISIIIDMLLFGMIVRAIPQGEYGTGIEIIAVLLFWIIYIPYIIGRCKRMYQGIKAYDNIDDIRDLMWRTVPVSIIVKSLFILVETIWIIEIR